jgi:sensor histidine kinase YesM
MRYEPDANIVCEIDDAQVHGHMIAPLLTFTFVENAFKYGLKRRTGGFIQLVISVNGDCFYFSARNDKSEMKENAGFGGIGIENARKRLQLLYPSRHTLSITDTGKTFCVELTINMDK